jgi:hypothetical protein
MQEARSVRQKHPIQATVVFIFCSFHYLGEDFLPDSDALSNVNWLKENVAKRFDFRIPKTAIVGYDFINSAVNGTHQKAARRK